MDTTTATEYAPGCPTRADYLRQLAEDYGVPRKHVFMLAHVLGPNEDFDGLVTEVQDLSESEDFDDDC